MFSKKIVETDLFMEMSPTAKLLYFYLNMSADDDGFVGNPKTIKSVSYTHLTLPTICSV